MANQPQDPQKQSGGPSQGGGQGQGNQPGRANPAGQPGQSQPGQSRPGQSQPGQSQTGQDRLAHGQGATPKPGDKPGSGDHPIGDPPGSAPDIRASDLPPGTSTRDRQAGGNEQRERGSSPGPGDKAPGAPGGKQGGERSPLSTDGARDQSKTAGR